ncbi:MAG: DctP family TRAP transporter solute-binding subunit [Candidatus Competibacter denitrificans]
MIKKQAINKLLASLAGALALSALALGTANAEIRDHNFKIAIAVAAGTAHYDGGVKFTELLSEKSGGKMKAKMFGNGTLGKDIAVVSSMQGGVIDMGIMNANLLTGLIKDFGVLDFPFAFANEKIAYKVLDGEWGTQLSNKLLDKGLISLGYWEMGFLNYHTGARPIQKLEDISGLKIRVTETPLQIDFQNMLGANAVPIAYVELYTALEQHTVDGGTQTFINLKAAKLFEVQKYVTITNHMYNPQMLLMSKKVYDKLSEDEKKVLNEAALEARDYQRQLSQKYGAEALEFLKTKLAVNVLPPEEIAKMKEKSKPLIEKYSKEYGEATAKGMYEAIEQASKP